MKLLQIIALFLIMTLFSNCVFFPSIAMGAKKGFDAFKDTKDALEDLEYELDSAEIYTYEDDSMTVNEAPAMDDNFDFDDVECMEAIFYLDKMNVVYIGVDNPCRIFISDVPNQHIEIEASDNLEVIEQEGGFYNIRANRPGTGTIYVIADDYEQEFQVRMKRIPDPIARLGTKQGGEMRSGEFKAQGGVAAWLDNFDFDARCKIASFSMTRIAADGSRETVENQGARFNELATALKNKATIGDIFLFENVKSRCPGDAATRRGNSMIFRIK